MKLYRKLLSALIAVMLILGLFSALPAFAEDKPQVAVTVTIDKQSVPGGGDVTLSFAFDQRVEDVSSFSFYVEYDASLFTYDTGKSKMPDDYYANCNQNPYTIAYTETTPQTNLAKFGFGHISTVAAAFDGKDDYAEGVFYQMVFTAKSDITTDVSATFKLNPNGTQMLTYSFKEDGSLESITNEVDLTINRVSAGEGGEANTKSVTVTGPAWDDTTADISWYTNGTDPYIIRTAAELAGLASIVNGTAKDDAGNAIKDDFSDKTVTLANDIDLLNWNWTPIGRRTSGSLTFDSFAGTFNGDSHTITNLSITYDIAEHITPDGGFSGCVGLFGKVTGTEAARAEVKDLTLEGKVTITASDPSFSGGVQSFGGLAGRADYADFSNCIVNVDIKEDISNISEEVVEGLGGVVGSAKFIEIESCANLGKIEAIRISKVGGIAGEISDGNVVIKDCCNRGDVSAEEKGTAGGIVGDITFKKNTESFISNCYNTGTITTGTPSYPPGALFGKITKKNKNTSIVNVNNLYFLDSSCTKGQGKGDAIETIPKTAEEMQAGCFVDLLNSNHAWKQGSTYPILVCQPYEEPGSAHALTKTEAKEATCAEAGNIAYWTCSACGKLFSDAEGTTETTAEEVVIAKLAHKLEKTEAKAASCTEAGNIDYWTCSACEKLFLDAEGTTETTAEEVVIAKLAHTLAKTEAKAATCTEAGNIAYWTCSACERLFSDDTGTKEVNTEDTVIAALDHDWGDWMTITPATDASEGAEERECSRCHMKETQPIPPLTHIHGLEHINAVSASCTEPGNIEYWQCNTSAGDGMTPCHRYFADEAGTTEINAEDTVVKALGHTWDDGVITKEPTTYSVGEKTYTCTVCKETKTEDIPKLDLADYTAVDSAKAKAAALDRDQYTEDSLKAVDDAVAAVIEGKPLSEQEAVNAMATAIENAIAALVLKPEKQAEAAIENLPKAEDLTLADADAVKEARAAYEALSDEEKETFPDTVLKDLKLAETTLAKLEAQAETAKMQEEIDKLNEALAQAAKEIAEMKEALAKTPGWHTNEDGKKYYCDSQGEMVKGWISDDGKWYFTDKETGFMQTDWLKDGSTWYYLNEDGAMATGWVKDDDKWYYMNTSGAMMTGWVKVGNTWYFMTSSGAMAANEWCNGYWLNANGSWTYQPRGSWKQDSTGWWFGDTSGWYAKSTTQKINGTNYTFNAAGYWVQ